MLDFRRCGDCGTSFPRGDESCPGCGSYGLGLREALGGRNLPVTGGLPVLAVVLSFFVPHPFGGVVLCAGVTPLIAAIAWLLWRRRARDEGCFAARIERVEERLEELEQDLEDTGRRLEAARADLERETRARAAGLLERELAQDRRLQAGQRRLVAQLERRLERLEIERFRVELRYFEACRDAQIDSRDLAEELHARLRELERRELGEAWAAALEDGRLLQRQLARGVRRLRAARRLDPLAHADLAGTNPAAGAAEEGDLDEQIDHQLERIERSFDAVAELAAELVGNADASGVRLRVDEDVLAALDEAELEVVERDRISFESL